MALRQQVHPATMRISSISFCRSKQRRGKIAFRRIARNKHNALAVIFRLAGKVQGGMGRSASRNARENTFFTHKPPGGLHGLLASNANDAIQQRYIKGFRHKPGPNTLNRVRLRRTT